jgi:hypothetical protein
VEVLNSSSNVLSSLFGSREKSANMTEQNRFFLKG